MALSHPYLTGNYAPVKRELPLTACKVVEGRIPEEYAGGQYVRNGGNPLADEDDGRNAHWFDGDGMLTGVLFKRGESTVVDEKREEVQPHFINRYILTDVLLSTSSLLKRPLLPSITTFASPLGFFSFVLLLLDLGRAVILALLSWLPFQKTPGLKRISVANTSIWWHDGQAFAGCDSGPPIRVLLPGLETADWWTGQDDDGKGSWAKSVGPIKMINEFTTAHTRVDPITNELLLYHMSFVAPFLRVSVIPPRSSTKKPLLGAPVLGMKQPKLAHDFCATSHHTILIDLPLVLDPRNLAKGKSMLEYRSNESTRFAIIPRWQPENVTWYESEGCCIYHSANAWDSEKDSSTSLLACRLNSATLVYSAGNITTPAHARAKQGIEKCQLYYWQFSRRRPGMVECEFPLSDVPFEFPTMNDAYSQRANRYIYGASMTSGTFDAGLGTRSAKIDCLVKMDVSSLIEKGKKMRLQGSAIAVDNRSVQVILQENKSDDSIRIFALPPHHYAQEATFVAKRHAQSEDDGYLTFFVFDEGVGLDAQGDCLPNATSQLWIIDAKNMEDVVCKIQLPSRVPYGLHGAFFSEENIQSQLPVRPEDVRTWALARGGLSGPGLAGSKAAVLSDGSSTIYRHLSSVTYNIRSAIERCL
jgi:carotenoid cleavage dioxygenase-like enzyme